MMEIKSRITWGAEDISTRVAVDGEMATAMYSDIYIRNALQLFAESVNISIFQE